MKRMFLICGLILCILFNANLQLNAQWFPTQFPDSLYVISIGVVGNIMFAGVPLPFDSSIFRSTDGGFSWQVASDSLTPKANILTFAVKDSFVLAGGVGWALFFRSSNNGDTWEPANTGIANQGGVYALTVLDTFIFVATSAGVFVSTNDGTNWQETNLKRGFVLSFAVIGSYLFAGAAHPTVGGPPGSVYLSTDYGVNWKTVNNGLVDSTVVSLAVIDSNIFAATGDGSVYRSTDKGQYWQKINTAPTDTYGSWLFVSDSILFISNTRGIFLSTDKGATWIDTKFPPGPWGACIGISSGYIFAGSSSGGLWARPLWPLLGVKDFSNVAPQKYSLKQNFPQPFNPSTTIQFTLPHESHVTLKIYNLLGQEVQTLVNETRTAGIYRVDFYAAQLSSGVYFYRLQAGKFVQTKKMLVIK